MFAIKAIVFDSDGTLLDGFSAITGAYAHVAALHGRTAPTAAEVQAQLAQSPPLYQILQTFFPGEDVQQMMRENGEYMAANASQVSAFAGLSTMLAALHSQGLKLAILTGGNHKIHDLLQPHGIGHYFTSVVHCDRVGRSKPDPEGYFMAMDECGTLPAESIMVGDSPTDIFTGKNAGAKYTVGITHGHGSHANLVAADPDYIVGSLDELTELIQKLCKD